MPEIDHASFLYGQNATFIAELYSRFVENPQAVDESWRQFFASLADEAPAVLAELNGPAWAKSQTRIIGAVDPLAAPPRPIPARRRSIRCAPSC